MPDIQSRKHNHKQVLINRFWKNYPAVGFIEAGAGCKASRNICLDLPTSFSFKTHHYAPPVTFIIGGQRQLDVIDQGELMAFVTQTSTSIL